jgi:hypothetical protein
MDLRRWALNKLSGGDYDQLRDRMTDALNITQSNLREFMDWRMERAREDAHWTNLLDTSDAQELGQDYPRADVVQWARWAFTRGDAFIKDGVLTKTYFCFGNGIDGPQGDPAEIEPLTTFWNHPLNQAAMFSTPMQYQRSNQLLLDGELFLLLFVGSDGVVQVRRVGSLLIDKIITHPDDSNIPLYYRARIPRVEYNPESELEDTSNVRTLYYQDHLNTDPSADPYRTMGGIVPNAVMLHCPINRLSDSGFGVSDVACSLSWFQAAKRIAEDQATISRVTAALAIMASIEGSRDDALALEAQIRSVTDTGVDPKAPLPGAFNFQNRGVNIEVDRKVTQSSDATQNSRLMRIAGAAGLGMTLHYMGDPENANLATADAMELPQMKHFGSYQALWVDIYRKLFNYVLREQGIEPDTLNYEISVPRLIDPKDVAGIGRTILDSYGTSLLTREQASERVLQLLGFDDIPQELLKTLAEPPKEEEPTIPPGMDNQLKNPPEEEDDTDE